MPSRYNSGVNLSSFEYLELLEVLYSYYYISVPKSCYVCHNTNYSRLLISRKRKLIMIDYYTKTFVKPLLWQTAKMKDCSEKKQVAYTSSTKALALHKMKPGVSLITV